MLRLIAELSHNPQWRAPLAVSIGAVPGALARYYLGLFCLERFGAGFPVGTVLINLSGAFVMGFFITFISDKSISSPDLRLLVAVGFLGSYTTFSTYALDASNLLRSDQSMLALLYGLGSAGLGLICLELGRFTAGRLF
jgi:fluoride exporter